MGVQGLWQLLDPLGRPVALESLENKILAVDASIWLHQAVHGCRDKNGNPLPNAHLLSLFNRICKLLFYGIKPVFVFDGAVPLLKKQTMITRRARQQNAAKEAEKTRKQILNKFLQRKAIQDVLEANNMNTKLLNNTSSKCPEVSSQQSEDMFKLPPIPSTSETMFHHVIEESESDSNSGEDPMVAIFQNLDAINIDSNDFRALPLEIQHEILLEIQDRNKQRSRMRREALPVNSEEIGNYQIQQLLKRRKIRQRIDTIKKSLTASITRHLVAGHDDDDDGFEAYSSENLVEAKRIASEDSAHYILLKKLHNSLFPAKVKSVDAASLSGRNIADSKTMEVLECAAHNPGPAALVSDDSVTEALVHTASNSGPGTQIIADSVTEASAHEINNLESASPANDNSMRGTKMDGTSSVKAARIMDSALAAINKSFIAEYLNCECPHASVNKATISAPVEVSLIAEVQKSEPDIGSMVANQVKDKLESQLKPCTNSDASRSVIQSLNYLEGDRADDHRSNSKLWAANSNLPVSTSVGMKDEVIELKNQQVSQDLIAIQRTSQKDSEMLNVQVTYRETAVPVKDTEVLQISISSEDDDDDDFIEVEVIPERAAEDDLFPAEIFSLSPSRNSSKEASLLCNEVGVQDTELQSPAETFFLSGAQTSEELHRLSEELEGQTTELLQDKARQERTAATITDQMYLESQELLRLFGIPFVVSPAEAEAQCAIMDTLELTDGTITDDSDIWLFGAKCVYKNFFERKREVLCFCKTDVERRLHLDRSKLIALALLTGSDYTEGIKSVGVVTALEILGEFSDSDGITTVKKFRLWWDISKEQMVAPSETKVKQKLRGLVLRDGFPSQAVIQAYLEPVVDSSKEKFSWAFPDLDALRTFSSRKLGWSIEKTNDVLLPIIKKLNAAREQQMRITSYFIPVARDIQDVKHPSRRLKRALRKVKSCKDEPKVAEFKQDEDSPKTDRPSNGKSKQRDRRKTKGQCQSRQQSTKEKGLLQINLGLSESSSLSEADSIMTNDPGPIKRKRRTIKKR